MLMLFCSTFFDNGGWHALETRDSFRLGELGPVDLGPVGQKRYGQATTDQRCWFNPQFV